MSGVYVRNLALLVDGFDAKSVVGWEHCMTRGRGLSLAGNLFLRVFGNAHYLSHVHRMFDSHVHCK